VLNRTSVLAYSADCPADNHARQLAQFLYWTLALIVNQMTMKKLITFILALSLFGCHLERANETKTIQEAEVLTPDYVISAEKNHSKFSSTIPYQLKVTDGSVIEVFTQEATGGQLDINSTWNDWEKVDFDRVHTLTGPIFVEGAKVGDVLAVELLELEPGNWGWTVMGPNMGFLEDGPPEKLKTYEIDKENNLVNFNDNISIPLKPFFGVIGVAPDTEAMLLTLPPRANGGNMDDPNLVEGVTVYLPVFVEGALLSLGDPHAAQGLGEVVVSAVECDMRAKIHVKVIKGKKIAEPQYETEDYYATTGFGTTIDEAAKKATRYMIEHISKTYNISWGEAYMLCSLVGDLKIASAAMENKLVIMHIPKDIFKENN